jgi:cell wall-associated NlpC family hydrolase
MRTIASRATARLIAAPLILTVLVTAQAAGTADASPVSTATAESTFTFTLEQEQQIRRELTRKNQVVAQERAERRARAAAARERAAAAIGERIVAAAAAQAGKPYVYGATGPSAFDCSGLTGWAYAAVGIHLPRTSSAQAAAMTRVSQPLPGDLVFFPGHIGIYAGNHQMWHAPNSGDVVKLSTIWTDSVTYGRIR